MSNALIPWENINEKQFEEICLYLAEVEMPELNMDLYLKKGNKQHGIDIKAFDLSNGKNICIQCKQYTKIELSNLEEAIKEFKIGQFFGKTSKFIIATSADLQSKKLKNYTDRQVEEFNNIVPKIKLDWWDRGNIEKKLRRNYRLVLKYFDKNVADKHCFLSSNLQKRVYEPYDDYIDRKILKVDNDNIIDGYRHYFNAKDAIDLKNVFLSKTLITKKVCLIADAYQGKSTLLKQLAYELSHKDSQLSPILIIIKERSISPIENILDNLYSYWKDCPSKELVIILDGLDEVANNEFIKFAININEFSEKFPSISILFSCRKLFYNHYKIYNDIKGFDFYELFPLQEIQIQTFLEKELKNKKSAFEVYISKFNLGNFMYDPFYLNNLVKLYKTANGKNLPKNKKEIFEYIISKSYIQAQNRILSDGRKLNHEEAQYNLCIRKLALVCQIYGSNFIDDIAVQKIFDKTERELLAQSSMLTMTSQSWTFNSTYFQENLAALALINLSLETILRLISVGERYIKVKTKWIQTIASFISLIDITDYKRVAIISVIEKDNIELLTFCDASKLEFEFRLGVVKNIMNRCINNYAKPILIRENSIANFIKDKEDALVYLLSLITQEIKIGIKIICWNIIYHFANLFSIAEYFEKVILDELSMAQDSYYASILVDNLGKYKISNEKLISELILERRFFGKYDYLNSLYRLLIECNLVDQYYYFGLSGIDFYSHPKEGILPYGTEKILEKYLLHTNNTNNIIALFKKINTTEWESFFRETTLHDDKKMLLDSLLEKAIKAYDENPLIIFDVGEFVKKKISKYYSRKDYQTLFNFFKRTHTSLIFFKLCLIDVDKIDYLLLQSIFTEECIDYILYEYEEGNFSENNLLWLSQGIRNWIGNEYLGKKLYEISLQATENSIINQVQIEKNKEHEQFEVKKLQNDLKYIQSQDTFIAGLKLFFLATGKKRIPDNELFVGVSDNPPRRRVDSNFIANFFLYFERNKKIATLNESIKYIKNTEWFNWFRAKEILEYNCPNEESKKVLNTILKNYYYEEIKTAVFQNCIKKNRTTNWKEHLLSEIYLKHQFDTSDKILAEMIWLVIDGFNHLKKAAYDSIQKNNLSNLIIENIDKEILIETVLSNIRLGIESHSVLKSHLEFCRHLEITEACDLILTQLGRFSGYDQVYIISIYNELNGDKTNLFRVFNNVSDFNDYLYIELVTALKEEYTIEITNSLLNVLDKIEVNLERKIEAAQQLTSIGNEMGFSFLINKIKEEVGLTENILRVPTLDKIDTKIALKEYHNIIEHIFDKNVPIIQDQMHTPSRKDILLDSLYQLAKKSEKDLYLVEDFLIKSQEEFGDKYPEDKSIFFHIDRIIEKFRETDNCSFEIYEVKEILNQIKY